MNVPIIMELNDFANHCGYFHNAYLTDDVSLNNGYNCRHEKQEERSEDNGKIIGCCYGFSCPLAYAADYDDLVKHGVIEPCEADREYYDGSDDYVIVSDEETIRRLRARGVTGLAER